MVEMNKLYLLGFAFNIFSFWIFKRFEHPFGEGDIFLTIGFATINFIIFIVSFANFLKVHFPKSKFTKILSYLAEMVYWGWQPSNHPYDKYARKISKILFISIAIILLVVIILQPKKTEMLGITQIETGDELIPYKYIISYKEVNYYTGKQLPWHKSWTEEVYEE